MNNNFDLFVSKMISENMDKNAINSFKHAYSELLYKNNGMISEQEILPLRDVKSLENDIKKNIEINKALLNQVVVVKLNGGLGTSMGLSEAKSLLKVKDEYCFLDLIILQIKEMRKFFNSDIHFLLMNSFNTNYDTINFINKKYSDFDNVEDITFIQNKIPKVDKETLNPVKWEANPELEWCPPGHADLYTVLYSSGKLDDLLSKGIKYMFISNSDNLGGVLDLEILSYFSEREIPFMMECCKRTEADKKGGHLAIRKSDNQLILREIAQCSKEDKGYFEDIEKHEYFNTNNLWLRLDILKEIMDKNNGILKLPIILNEKTVDPINPNSTKVIQLESAMGSAIECLKGSSAIVVPRNRFVPIKKCADLFLLRSNAYHIEKNYNLSLTKECEDNQPIIDLDNRYYKNLIDLEKFTKLGIPNLIHCKKLSVTGKISFNSNCIIKGIVNIINNSNIEQTLKDGVYENTTVYFN